MVTVDDAWLDEAFAVWERLAPTYIHKDVWPLAGRLRQLGEHGMTIQQFEEALEIAFDKPGVTKRNALRYAYGIVNRQLRERAPAGDG